MSSKPLVTTGIASMFAGDIFFMGPNTTNGLVPLPAAFALWLAFGIATAFAGDTAYNRWNSPSRTPTHRLVVLWTIIFTILLSVFVLSKIGFFIARSIA
ncbi:hypothetical protein LU699_15490 [Luteimonas fraxinea]|uniref:hypothetical protein n=1 Tax=Luteimonas fraxinea TaxID=2901869 RepID=UPI001E2EAE79|nr:hypothetical protein [Luteimonas fraxinea]UHH09646.1 hypothetical protein LU699_15490 [Luteimonas fraxinea]